MECTVPLQFIFLLRSSCTRAFLNIDGYRWKDFVAMDGTDRHEQVSEYYGTTLKSSKDLRTSACCPVDCVPRAHVAILNKLHSEVTSRFYGCGSPIPSHLDGMTVLDLGCGTGRDVYLASALVGSRGKVIGIDMTQAQLEVAKKYQQFHADVLLGEGHESNVQFREGIIEDLKAAKVEDDSVDVVISNCVCNLSPDKSKVFSEVFRVLKNGGEFYFSDIYADRRLTSEAASNPVLVGECLGGALYVEDFRRVMAAVGFSDVRIVSSAPVNLHDEELLKLVPDVSFNSVTVRAFKVDGIEDRCEDYGQTATYDPSACGSDEFGEDKDGLHDKFKLDIDNIFSAGCAKNVDMNTARIIEASRFRKFFKVTSEKLHRGLFYRAENCEKTADCLQSLRAPARQQKSTSSNGAANDTRKVKRDSCEETKVSAATCCGPKQNVTRSCC